MEALKVTCLEWAVAAATPPGETECGDSFLVHPRPDGVLVAAIDGLGHGHEALKGAKRAIETLKEAEPHETTLDLVRRCHLALVGTRGVVMSLGIFRPAQHSLTWIGVGNVEGLLVRSPALGPAQPERLVSRGGVVGDRLPALQAALLPVNEADTLVFATDGLTPDFETSIVGTDAPQTNADRILANHSRRTDDALVLVVRYLGKSGKPA